MFLVRYILHARYVATVQTIGGSTLIRQNVSISGKTHGHHFVAIVKKDDYVEK